MKTVLVGMTVLASASVLMAGCTGSITSSEVTSNGGTNSTSASMGTALSSQNSSTRSSPSTTETVNTEATKNTATSTTESAPKTDSKSTRTETTSSATQIPTSATSSTTPSSYRLTPTTLAGLKLPIKEKQIPLLSKRLGKPTTVNKAHCSFAAGIGKAGRQHKWGDLILATDPFEKPKQYTYWYLTGSDLPKNLKPSFMIGTGGSVKALKKKYPKVTHDVADPSFGGYLFGPGLPVWYELDSEIIAVQSADIGCLRSE